MSDNLKTEFETAVDGMTPEHMPNDDLAYVAESCGNGVAVALVKRCAGMMIAVPKSATRKVAEVFIIDKFDGSNAKQLARATGFSLRHVYEVVQAEDERRKNKNTKGKD
jgi:hypothetical protein